MTTGPGIVTRGLVKRFGAALAVDGVNLDVAAGDLVALVGPSGSGKTTLLRLIAGLEVPDAGEVAIGGRMVSQPGFVREPHRRGIGFVFQSGALWPHMRVAQNILFALHGRPAAAARERLGELVAQMDLDGLGRRYPDQLSAGQARRVALARALAPEPAILLLDEPLTNVEPELKARLAALILAQAAQTGATVIHVTHDAAEARLIGRHVLAMRAGRLTDDGR